MTVRTYLCAFIFAALVLPAATAHAANPFGRNFSLTKDDVAVLADTTRPLLEDDTVPLGTVKSWNSPKSGNGGTVTLVDRFEYKGLPCRRIQHDIKLKKVIDPFRFIVDRCRVADGSWKTL